MLLPGAVTVMGAALFSLCLQIPANTGLERVWTENVSPRLWAELLGRAGLLDTDAVFWCLDERGGGRVCVSGDISDFHCPGVYAVPIIWPAFPNGG